MSADERAIHSTSWRARPNANPRLPRRGCTVGAFCYAILLADLFRLDATVESIEHGQLCLLYRCDGIVDGETGFRLHFIGVVFGSIDVDFMLHVCSLRLQGGHVGGDFCFQSIPVPGGRVAGRSLAKASHGWRKNWYLLQ